MDIKIDETTLQYIVQKAIVEKLTSENRDELISKAIQDLIIPKTDSYGKQSVINRLFKDAVENIAREYIHKSLSEDPKFRKAITDLFQNVLDKVFNNDENREKLADSLALSMTRHIDRF